MQVPFAGAYAVSIDNHIASEKDTSRPALADDPPTDLLENRSNVRVAGRFDFEKEQLAALVGPIKIDPLKEDEMKMDIQKMEMQNFISASDRQDTSRTASGVVFTQLEEGSYAA
jgi:hypothetical protein